MKGVFYYRVTETMTEGKPFVEKTVDFFLPKT